VVSAATAEEQQARLGGRIAGLQVGHVMAARPTVLDGNLSVADFIAQVALTHQYSTYPLVDRYGRLTGLVTLNRVRAVPPELRATTRLQEIACPPNEVPTARPEEPLVELLERMHAPMAALLSSTKPAWWSECCLPATWPARCNWLTYAPSIPIQHLLELT
jgi:CBS-domain-containing membrane protein